MTVLGMMKGGVKFWLKRVRSKCKKAQRMQIRKFASRH